MRGRVFPAATLQSGKPSVKSIDKASSRSAPSGEAALRCKSHVFAQQHEALKHAITSNSRRTIKFISKLKKGKKKSTGTREEKQATNLPFTGSFHSVCFIRDAQNVLQVLFFSSRVSVIFFSLSFRRGRDLRCMWRQPEGGAQSACCDSGYIASGAQPLNARK